MESTKPAENLLKVGKQKKKMPKGRKKIILFGVILLICLGAAFGIYRLFFTEEEKVSVTGKTTYGYLNEAVEGSGTTTPADSVSYDVNGTVLEWNVSAGDDVKEGDLLFVMDSSDVEDDIQENQVDLNELYEKLEDIEDNIAGQNVTAPFAGRVESLSIKEGKKVQNGTTLLRLIDDSSMTATLYFSYAYQDSIAKGMKLTVSVPDQMLNLTGTVTDIAYVDYLTKEGMRCFAVDVTIPNPGSLTEGMSVSGWLSGENGEELYAVNDAELEFAHSETISAETSGEVTGVKAENYQRVKAGQLLLTIDASGYSTQLENTRNQIDYYEERIADLREEIATEYTRYADISGQVVTATYSKNRMTGKDMGTVSIYDQTTMQISVNIDELDADSLYVGMPVTVYRETSSRKVYYDAELTYLSLEASSGSSGVSTFAAEITIDSKGELPSGVTVYYSIDTSGGSDSGETVLAPLAALCTYDDGYYLLVEAEKAPEGAIDPADAGGSVTEYPDGFYAVPVEVGDFNGSYIQILSGVEKDATLFLRYRNAAPGGGDSTSKGNGDESGMPDFSGMGGMPDFGGMGGMSSSGGNRSSSRSGGMGGGMPNFGE